MFKFVVFFVVVAAASAAPGLIGGDYGYGGLSYGGYGGYGGHYAIPAATSYASRVDVHSTPYIKTLVAAPVVTKAVVTAPVVTKAVVAAPWSYGVHTPIVSGYGLGHNTLGYGLGSGYGNGYYGYGHGW